MVFYKHVYAGEISKLWEHFSRRMNTQLQRLQNEVDSMKHLLELRDVALKYQDTELLKLRGMVMLCTIP